MKRLFKSKAMAIALALVMVFAMSGSVFATSTDAITAADNGMYRNVAYQVGNGYQNASGAAITTFTLKASLANSYYSPIGFASSDNAEDVEWTSSDNSVATVPAEGTAVSSVSGIDGTYDSQATVTLTGTNAGSCTIEANYNGAIVNFTVVIEKVASSYDTVNNLRVIVEDYEGYQVWDDNANVTATAPAADSTSVFFAKTKAAQTFATASSALEKVATITVSADGNYIPTIKGVSENYANGTGWTYCVLRYNAGMWSVVHSSIGIPASDFALKDGDCIFWAYTTYSSMNDLFEAKAAELNQ